jgi:hypothetical protein
MQKPPITLEWVTFLNPTALEAGLLTFKRSLDKNAGIQIGSKTIRDVSMGYYILSYSSKEQAEKDYIAFQSLYTETSKTKIMPKPVTVFEYNDTFHIALSVEEKVDKSKGLDGIEYQGFIVDPIIYLQQKNVQEITKNI